MVADPKAQQVTVDVDIAALSAVVAADADLLPGHAHDAIGAHPPADPVLTVAVVGGSHRVRRRGRRCAGVEPLSGGVHLQCLMGTVDVVVCDPLIESLLGDLQVWERFSLAEKFSPQAAMKPLNLARSGWRAWLGQQVLDAVLTADGVKEDLDRGIEEPAGEHLAVEFLRDVKLPRVV